MDNQTITEQPKKKDRVYISNSMDYLQFPTDRNFFPCFTKDNMTEISKNKVLPMMQSGVLDEDDVKLTEFIYASHYSVKDQLLRFCAINGIENGESRIENLITAGIINQFFLITTKDYYGSRPEDARMIYCLRSGGKVLLDAFSDRYFIDWTPGDNYNSTKKIQNAIIMAENFLDMASAKVEVKNFENTPVFDIRGVNLTAQAYYGFRKKGDESGRTEYLLFDIARSTDNIDDVRKQSRLWESLIATQIWKKYFNDAKFKPLLVYITDNDESAKALAELVLAGTKINMVLMTTPERMKRGIAEPGRFLKLEKESGQLEELNHFKLFE